jgi:predicted metalloprotease with PDZ domain
MRGLWQAYREQGKGVEPDSIQQLVSEISGIDLRPFLDQLIYGTGELPLPELLASVGIEVLQRVAKNAQDKGGKNIEGDLPGVDFGAMLKDSEAGLVIQRVVEAGAAQSSGLSAGDQIIAIDGLKLNLGQLENKVLRASPGDVWRVHAFRRDELHRFDVVLQAAAETTFVLKVTDHQQAARQAWLGT